MQNKITKIVGAVGMVGLGAFGYVLYHTATQPKAPVVSSQPQTNKPSFVAPQNPKNLVEAHNALGFNMTKSLSTEEKQANVFISPTSVSLALSMVYNGAAGQTQADMAKTLQFQKMNTASINQESLGLINTLKNPDKKVELAIANSIWMNKTSTINPSFVNTIKDSYNAEATTLDFTAPIAKTTINSWVKKQTKDKIPEIVDSTNGKVLILVNAAYFKGTWTNEFDKAQTADRNFMPSQGAAYKKPFMKQSSKMAYFGDNAVQSVELPYGENERMRMNVFLPKDVNSFVSTLDAATWNQYMARYKKEQGTLLLPKFRLEYSKSLANTLGQLGMKSAFTDAADFSGIAKGVTISEVQHKTFLDVNEEGTEAAAVTSVEVVSTSVDAPKENFTMDVNRPFFVAIRDTKTGELLFTGVIRKP